MKIAAASFVLATAAGVSAHPSAHGHQNAHRSVAARDFFKAVKPAAPAPSAPSAAVSVPAPSAVVSAPTATASAASSASATGESVAQDVGNAVSSLFKPFCGGNTKRATAAEIAYKGNTGAPGQYGCNIMTINSGAASQYDYVINFSNASGDDQSCACWNKIGPTGGINGFFKGNQAMTFDLPAGGSQSVAMEANSQGACTCGAGGLPYTAIGEFAGTWVEFDMANESNGGWSGADASCLVAAAGGTNINGLKVCGSGTCSTINQGGSGTNAYVAGTAAADGIGLNLAPGKVTLTVEVSK